MYIVCVHISSRLYEQHEMRECRRVRRNERVRWGKWCGNMEVA